MNARDAALLVRFWTSLDTLANDAEIAATVRQIRRLGGPGVFEHAGKPKPAAAGHTDRLTAPRHVAALRGLGFLLRRWRHHDAEIETAKQRAGEAFIDARVVEPRDLLLLLVFMRQLVEQMAKRDASSEDDADSGSMNEMMRAALDAVMRSMWS